MWRFTAIVALVGVAHAAPFREQLTKDEIEAASNATLCDRVRPIVVPPKSTPARP